MLNKSIIKIVSLETGLPPKLVEHIYKVFWKKLRKNIEKQDLISILEGRKDILANCIIPGLGTLKVNEQKLKVINGRDKNKKD